MSNADQSVSITLPSILLKYKFRIAILLILTFISNVITVIVPRFIQEGVDSFNNGGFDSTQFGLKFALSAIAVLTIALVQIVISSRVSESIARNLREMVMGKISIQSIAYINEVTSSRLLTNLTSDVDAVKSLISQGIVLVISSVILLVGSSIAMMSIRLDLALVVMLVIPVLLITFFVVFSNLGKIFEKSQANIDALNKVINETIIGSMLVRVLNSFDTEILKFNELNQTARSLGMKILNVFASLIPSIGLIANLAVLAIVWFGGNQVISGELTYGQFNSFYVYIGIFLMPIFILGFVSNNISRAFTSFTRISEVLNSEVKKVGGDVQLNDFKGEFEIKNLSLTLSEKAILKNINLNIKSKSRNAIIGPTGAGKTQLIYLLTGLIEPTEGEIFVDKNLLHTVDPVSFYSNVGVVFQDSIIFNMTIRNNITFGREISDDNIELALKTAEMWDFVQGQPNGIDTKLTERGSSLSGGQKQRLTLARALAHKPSFILLDDFTARVDRNTEKRIFENLQNNYPGITILQITQKIDPIKDYDQIILLMEGELIDKGNHEDLLKRSFEYKQIYNSQMSTE